MLISDHSFAATINARAPNGDHHQRLVMVHTHTLEGGGEELIEILIAILPPLKW